MQIKELCQSPKSNRLSMFSFSSSPASSPELQTNVKQCLLNTVYHSDGEHIDRIPAILPTVQAPFWNVWNS